MLRAAIFCSKKGEPHKPDLKPAKCLPPRIHAEATEFGVSLAGLFLKSVERFAELQKQSIDVAVQHSAEMSEVMKKMAEKLPGAPQPAVFEMAAGNVARCADTQKSAINFVVKQSKAWTDTFKDRSLTAKDSQTQTARRSSRPSNARLRSTRKSWRIQPREPKP